MASVRQIQSWQYVNTHIIIGAGQCDSLADFCLVELDSIHQNAKHRQLSGYKVAKMKEYSLSDYNDYIVRLISSNMIMIKLLSPYHVNNFHTLLY